MAGAGVSSATLFYKFRPGALAVHAKQVNKQRLYIFFSMTKKTHTHKTNKPLKLQNKFYVFKVSLGLKIVFESKNFGCLHNMIK